ncbi:MAG TPA: type II secretion system protein [Gemmatimonadales bacterium]|nr:type II secretion system protein [Gemmatimonadales bacterium]
MRRNGFTLIEMMIVIVIMGIMLAMAMPKLHDWSSSADARGARTAATTLLAKARAAAIQNNQVTTASFNGTSGAVVTVATNDTLQQVAMGSEYGITMSPSSWSVTYDPRGIGSYQYPVTVTFTKSGKSSSLTVSGYGRVVSE